MARPAVARLVSSNSPSAVRPDRSQDLTLNARVRSDNGMGGVGVGVGDGDAAAPVAPLLPPRCVAISTPAVAAPTAISESWPPMTLGGLLWLLNN